MNHLALFTAMLFIVALGFCPTAEAGTCEADVSFDEAVQSSEVNWSLRFDVDVDDCDWSSGSFEFDVEIVDSAEDDSMELRRVEAWRMNDESEETVEYKMILRTTEEVEGVSVDDDTIKCVCRAPAGD